MKISVIIPVYNTENYLKECLQSLIGQTMEDMEILVVDDGSTDRSLKIAQDFQRKYPEKVMVFAKENGGQASARNMALRYAKGDFLGFVDSDDWVDTIMYQEMYNVAIRENADIVICDTIDHYQDRDLYHQASKFESKFKVTPSACNKIFKREMIGEDVFPHGLWYEDFEFTTKQLMKTDKIAVVHKPFYHCHCRESSTMSNNNSVKNLDILVVLENLERFAQDRGWQEKYSEIIEYLYLDHVLITSINRVQMQQSKEKKMVVNKMRQVIKSKYPNFPQDKPFLDMPKNRKIVALLNNAGLAALSNILIRLKGKMK